MSLESLSYRGVETLDKIEGTEQGILLGSSISLNFKNTRVAIGHLGNVTSQGKVTVSSLIDANSNTWQTSNIITGPSASNGSYFGHAVSMNWAGTRIAVGAHGVNKVYVFDATSTSANAWATYVSNTISGYTDSNFGYSVSLGQDIDTTLAIGAPNHNRVDVWKLSNSSWSLAYSNIGDDIPNIIPLNATSNVTINSKLTSNVSSLQYGFSCKLAPFGTHLIIGAPGSFLNELTTSNSDVPSSDQVSAGQFSWSGGDLGFSQRQSGSARVFTTTDDWTSTVSQLGQTLSGWAADGNYVQNFTNSLSYDKLTFPSLGFSTSMNFDGSVIAIGSPNWTLYNNDSLSRSGNVVVYEYSTVSTLWEQRGSYIRGGGKNTCSGYDVKLDYTGNRLALSMLTSGSFPAVENHMLYVLDWSGTDWVEAQLPISSKDAGYGYNDEDGTKMFSGYRIDMTDGNQVAVSKLWWNDNDLSPDGSGASYVPLFPANKVAYGRVQFYFFLITATFSGNNLFEGYVVANQMMIGSNDASTSNGVAKRLRFGGTFGDNRYDETVIENRVITTNASELLLHKNHQTNETIDRVRIKAAEIHLDHMKMYHSVYQGGQESKDIQSPRFILDQYGTIAVGNLYSGNDSTSSTTSLAETYLDIKGETQIRDKLNVNYKNRSKLLSGHTEYVYMNTRCEDLITSSQIIDEKPGHVKVITISNGSGLYSSTEKAFEFTGTSSGIGQSDITGNWDGDDGMMMFWLKLKSAHSAYASNVLCSWGETLSSVSGVYRGGCLQLTSTGFTINLGSGIGTRTHATTLDTNKWYHICVRFPTEKAHDVNGVDETLNALYINGSSVSLSGTLTSTSSFPNWDSQSWHFGYGDASGPDIAGPAGTFMGNMIFYEDFNSGLITYGYNDGPPSECLSVGGDAIIENRLGVGTVTPAYEIDVDGTISSSNVVLAGGSSVESTPYYFTVTVNGSSKFVIDGTQQPTITLYRGVTYRFDQADSSNGSHPFRISTTAEGSQYASGSSYNGSNGSSGAYRQFIVPLDAPDTMYYNCSSHSSMGGTLRILSGIVTTSGVASSNVFVNNHMGIGIQTPKGPLHIHESTGSSHSAGYGTLVLEHGDSGGSSCIIFPSKKNYASDYGYIQYEDSTSGTNEKSRLIFGTENDGRGTAEDNIILSPSASVGIGTDTPTQAKLVVSGHGGSTYSVGTYGWLNNSGGTAQDTSNNAVHYSIYADNRIACSEFNAFSDSRIKKNVVDINDSSALDKIRLLEPKIYNYIDEKQRGTSNVYGFIAQEVSNVLPYAVTVGTGDIPNILTNSNVSVTSDSNVLELRLDTTVEGLTLSNTSNINITTDKDKYLTVPVLTFSGSNVITIQNNQYFSNVTGTYIHGEQVSNFHHLNKDAIWAVSTAALQEVDRQLQAEKAKVADLIARVTALENN